LLLQPMMVNKVHAYAEYIMGGVRIISRVLLLYYLFVLF